MSWTETKITSRLVKEIREVHGRHSVFNLHGHSMQAPGWPDLYFCLPGLQAWVEAKSASRELTLAQELVGWHLRDCGANAYVLRFITHQIYTLEDFNGKLLQSCGGADWKTAAESVVEAIRELSKEENGT